LRHRLALALALAGAPAVPVAAQAPPTRPPVPLATPALAGQAVALLPLTVAVADPALAGDSSLAELRGRERSLRWADSLIGDAFQARAPEVNWVLPERLRYLARRNPGMVPEPDRMGQAALRSPKMKRLPEPLWSSLRSLTAITGGRFALVPAALGLARDPDGGIRADLALALADARSGTVVWRTLSWGVGPSPGDALTTALAKVLPDPSPHP
jgi:hypothetical protein